MQALRDLTTLVAAHGVYALSVIFIFYQQRRAVQNLQSARTGTERKYFRHVHLSVMAATYVLVLASTVVWFYANYMYEPVRVIRGEVTGLHSLAVPSDVQIANELTPDSTDLAFYPVNDVPSLTTGEYQFRWAAVTRKDVTHIPFRFVQESESVAAIDPVPTAGADPQGAMSTSSTRRKKCRTEKVFVLDLAAIHYDPNTSIGLSYVADLKDLSSVGTLWFKEEDGTRKRISWLDNTPVPANGHATSRIWSMLGEVLHAAEPEASLFDKAGGYAPEVGRALRIQLGSDDLRTRLNARDALVSGGARSFRFMTDTLRLERSARPAGWLLVIDSLSKAIDEIEARGESFPADSHVTLAAAFYDEADYRLAAYHFEKGSAATGLTSLQLAMRAHSYLEIRQFPQAIQSFHDYLGTDITNENKAWAHNALGTIYNRLGHYDESIRERVEALKLVPNYPAAQNGLAYNYAKRGTNLSEALSLIDRALRQQPNELAFIQTRGYVLFKMGRYSEAMPILRLMAAKMPNDSDSQTDLKEAEAVVGRRVSSRVP